MHSEIFYGEDRAICFISEINYKKEVGKKGYNYGIIMP